MSSSSAPLRTGASHVRARVGRSSSSGAPAPLAPPAVPLEELEPLSPIKSPRPRRASALPPLPLPLPAAQSVEAGVLELLTIVVGLVFSFAVAVASNVVRQLRHWRRRRRHGYEPPQHDEHEQHEHEHDTLGAANGAAKGAFEEDDEFTSPTGPRHEQADGTTYHVRQRRPRQATTTTQAPVSGAEQARRWAQAGQPSPPLGDLDGAAEPVQATVVHEAISGNRFAWFRSELYHLPIEKGALPMSRKRAVRFVGRTRGAVLLVHGFSQNRFAWHLRDRSPANFLAEAGYDVFFLDLRGSRESRRLGAPMPVGIHEYVEIDLCQALRLVRALSGHERATLIGHSLGGALSCAVAAVMPDHVDGVMHVAGLYGFGHHKKPIWKRLLWLDQFIRTRLHFLPRALALPTREIGLLLRFLRYIINSPLGVVIPVQILRTNSVELPILSRYLYTTFEPASLAILQNITGLAHGLGFADEAGEDYLHRFARLQLPLYVICADQDDLVNVQDSLECFKASASSDKEQLVFVSDASSDADPAFGHCDILIGRRAVHVVWERMRIWLDARHGRQVTPNLASAAPPPLDAAAPDHLHGVQAGLDGDDDDDGPASPLATGRAVPGTSRAYMGSTPATPLLLSAHGSSSALSPLSPVSPEAPV